MRRRYVLLATLIIFAAPSCWAQAGARIALFHELVESLGVAGDAIAKLTDGFKHLIVTGAAGYSYVAAGRERDHLVDISRRTQNLVASQSVQVVQSMDDYLALPDPRPSDWDQVRKNLDAVLASVGALLSDVQREKSDFVLESAYLKLNKALKTRALVLERFANLPPPASPEERAAVRQASEKYKTLITNTEQAVQELNTYLRARRTNG